MNEMYSLTLEIHLGAIAAFALLALYNAFVLYKANDIKKYSLNMRMFVPISLMLLISMFFTGIVMMAAKRLDFDWFNIAMILANMYLISLEFIRYQRLKRVNPTQDKSIETYKLMVYKLIGSEFFIVMSFFALREFR